MIQIDDPPTITVCATCMSPLSWCYSARNRQWFAVVRVDEDTMRIHRCRLSAAPTATWREVRRGSPPSAEYLAVRASLSRTDTDNPNKITEETT